MWMHFKVNHLHEICECKMIQVNTVLTVMFEYIQSSSHKFLTKSTHDCFIRNGSTFIPKHECERRNYDNLKLLAGYLIMLHYSEIKESNAVDRKKHRELGTTSTK